MELIQVLKQVGGGGTSFCEHFMFRNRHIKYVPPIVLPNGNRLTGTAFMFMYDLADKGRLVEVFDATHFVAKRGNTLYFDVINARNENATNKYENGSLVFSMIRDPKQSELLPDKRVPFLEGYTFGRSHRNTHIIFDPFTQEVLYEISEDVSDAQLLGHVYLKKNMDTISQYASSNGERRWEANLRAYFLPWMDMTTPEKRFAQGRSMIKGESVYNPVHDSLLVFVDPMGLVSLDNQTGEVQWYLRDYMKATWGLDKENGDIYFLRSYRKASISYEVIDGRTGKVKLSHDLYDTLEGDRVDEGGKVRILDNLVSFIGQHKEYVYLNIYAIGELCCLCKHTGALVKKYAHTWGRGFGGCYIHQDFLIAEDRVYDPAQDEVVVEDVLIFAL